MTNTHDLFERIRRLEHQNRYLHYQNSLLYEAIDTICFAILNNPKDLDTAIQTALTMQRQAQLPDSSIQE